MSIKNVSEKEILPLVKKFFKGQGAVSHIEELTEVIWTVYFKSGETDSFFLWEKGDGTIGIEIYID
jgi:hypothetical protein